MATITDKRSINATLSTTTVDRAQLLQFWDYIEVYNGEASGGDMVYITDDGATDPVAAAEGTMSVAPGERLVFKARPLTNSIPDGSAVICHEIRVLGNGGLYSVLGLRAVDPLQAGTTVDAATTSVHGTVELATPAEARTGSSPSVVLTAEGGAAAAIDWSTPMAVGLYYPTGIHTGTVPMTVNRVYYVPISFRRACTLDRLAVGLTAAVASSVARLGIYTDTDGRPGSLVVDAGTVSTDAGLSVKEIAISQAVDRGRYWLACVSQGGASGATLRATQGYANGQLVSSAVAADFNTGGLASGFYESSVSGALPATATPVALLASVPVMIVRASA